VSYHATTQRARKHYQCAADYGHSPNIHPGEEYVRVRRMPEPGLGFAQHDLTYHPECYDKNLIDADEFN